MLELQDTTPCYCPFLSVIAYVGIQEGQGSAPLPQYASASALSRRDKVPDYFPPHGGMVSCLECLNDRARATVLVGCLLVFSDLSSGDLS